VSSCSWQSAITLDSHSESSHDGICATKPIQGLTANDLGCNIHK
jgi:hypothetical protein